MVYFFQWLLKGSWARITLPKTLNLLGALLVPLILGAGTILITAQQSTISQSQHETDVSIANNQFQEALLKTFRDDINRLVFDQHLLTAKRGDPVQVMAQSYTNDALRKLDLSRRVLLVQFLSDLHLITSATKGPPLILLFGADLHGVDLRLAYLRGADLHEANLAKALLQGADLHGANLVAAHLRGVSLRMANLAGANLAGANLAGANLEGAILRGANLSRSPPVVDYEPLRLRPIRWTDPQETGATPEQLARAWILKDAILPDGSRYPSTSYPIPNHHEPTF